MDLSSNNPTISHLSFNRPLFVHTTATSPNFVVSPRQGWGGGNPGRKEETKRNRNSMYRKYQSHLEDAPGPLPKASRTMQEGCVAPKFEKTRSYSF